MAEREVDDVDPEQLLVRRGERDGADDVARVADALAVQHLQANEPNIWRHALELARQRAAAADEARHVRAVAEVVVCSGISAAGLHVVIEGDDAAVEIL